MQENQKLDDHIDDPRHNIFTALVVILSLGGMGVIFFIKIIQEIIRLF